MPITEPLHEKHRLLFARLRPLVDPEVHGTSPGKLMIGQYEVWGIDNEGDIPCLRIWQQNRSRLWMSDKDVFNDTLTDGEVEDLCAAALTMSAAIRVAASKLGKADEAKGSQVSGAATTHDPGVSSR